MNNDLGITDEEVKNIPFFHDFIVYLKYLEKQPIKRTITGNISLGDIENLSKQFKEQEVFEEFKNFGWKISTEPQIQFLTQIKIIAEIMHLTYKHKDKLMLTKNGKGYLHNISPSIQYWNMVLYFWKRVNWEYFTPSREIYGISFSERVQDVQLKIWRALLKNGNVWITYKKFCKALEGYFNLSPYFEDDPYEPEHALLFEVYLVLFKRNLIQFGCVETEEKKDKHFIEIVRFRPTHIGLYIFQKAIYEDYL